MIKIKCNLCDRDISACNFAKHLDAHERGNVKQRLSIPNHVHHDSDGFYKCWICNCVKSKTKAGILSHVWRKHTQDGIILGEKICLSQKGRKAWNKGLNKQTSSIIAEQAAKQSQKLKEEFQNGKRKPNVPNEAFRKKLSIEQSMRNRGGKCKWFDINGIKVQGTWEKFIAEKMNEFNIVWVKPHTNNDVWTYFDLRNQMHSYAPDFFLPEYQVWFEIKGFWWGNDKEKMDIIKTQYPDRKILIIEKDCYLKLKSDFNYIFQILPPKANLEKASG